jgi:uncharacterized protein (TIRG00374 family)
MKKTVTIIGILLSILFLWLALRDTNVDEIRHAFADAKVWPIVPMFLCLGLFYWLRATRWSNLLSPHYDVTPAKLVPAMMAGAAGNNLLPAHFGEIIRVYYAGDRLGIPKSTVLATLVLERVLDIVIVLAMMAVAFFFGGFSQTFFTAGILLLGIAVVVGAGCVVLGLYTQQVITLIRERLPLVPKPLAEKIAQQVLNLSDGLASIKSGHLYLRVIGNSFLQWTLMAGCIYFSLVAFMADVSPLLAVVILGFTVAGLALPTSPGFFGTIEYCFVLGFATIGVDSGIAISAAIYYHLPAWVVVTLSGLLIVHLNNVSFSQLQAEARQA